MTDSAATQTLRPPAAVLREGVLAVLALTTPLFAVLYWLTIPFGSWPPVLLAHIAVLLLTLTGLVAYLATSIQIGPDGIRERGFFGQVSNIPLGCVASVLMVEVYRGSSQDTLPQLFLRGTDGRLLLRMRGQFWQREDMARVADALDAPVAPMTAPMATPMTGPVTISELRASHPRLLSWFERRPRLGRRPAA
ncbi:MAG: hypothetical protein ABI255_02895 [Microbacteriaceae bacterium]